MRGKRDSSAGFTLIELLMVIGIVGLLAAIAVPQYGRYKAEGFDARAQIMLRNVAAAEEAYFIDHARYRECDQSDCHLILPSILPIESGINLFVVVAGDAYLGQATHAQGSGEIFFYQQ